MSLLDDMYDTDIEEHCEFVIQVRNVAIDADVCQFIANELNMQFKVLSDCPVSITSKMIERILAKYNQAVIE